MNTTETRKASKAAIMQALREFTLQRPGLEFGNYGDVAIYRAESRRITKQAHDAMALLRYVDWHDSITADDLRSAMSDGGRLSLVEGDNGVAVDYCTGQYFPTEYRADVCRVMSSLLWRWLRSNIAASGAFRVTEHGNSEPMPVTREQIQKAARREFGAPIAKRWFN